MKKRRRRRIRFNETQGQLKIIRISVFNMSTKFDRRSNYHELIDDLVDTPSYNPTYSSLPGSLNTTDVQRQKRFTTDDRRNQLDAIIKQLSSPIQDEIPLPLPRKAKTNFDNLDVSLVTNEYQRKNSYFFS